MRCAPRCARSCRCCELVRGASAARSRASAVAATVWLGQMFGCCFAILRVRCLSRSGCTPGRTRLSMVGSGSPGRRTGTCRLRASVRPLPRLRQLRVLWRLSCRAAMALRTCPRCLRAPPWAVATRALSVVLSWGRCAASRRIPRLTSTVSCALLPTVSSPLGALALTDLSAWRQMRVRSRGLCSWPSALVNFMVPILTCSGLFYG